MLLAKQMWCDNSLYRSYEEKLVDLMQVHVYQRFVQMKQLLKSDDKVNNEAKWYAMNNGDKLRFALL